METTGLDENKCVILELGAKITNSKYEILDEFKKVVSTDPGNFTNMNMWCWKQHTKSGLLLEAIESRITSIEVEHYLLEFLDKHDLKENIVIYGNSIHFDRKFIKKYMPVFEQRLHYRMVDVSSFKCYFQDRFGVEYMKDENTTHRVLYDIDQSINELKYYSKFISINIGINRV